jgi:hypothetical protein
MISSNVKKKKSFRLKERKTFTQKTSMTNCIFCNQIFSKKEFFDHYVECNNEKELLNLFLFDTMLSNVKNNYKILIGKKDKEIENLKNQDIIKIDNVENLFD